MTDIDRSEIDAVIACLGDDAAQLRQENDEDERAANMDRAAELLEQIAGSNTAIAHLLLHKDREECKAWAKGLRINMDTDGGLTVRVALEPMRAWTDYARRAGLLNEDGIATNPSQAQTAYNAYSAAWNDAVKACDPFEAAVIACRTQESENGNG